MNVLAHIIEIFLLIVIIDRLYISRSRYKFSFRIDKVRFRISIEEYNDEGKYLTRHDIIHINYS